jgi:Uma2 family endonuclease
VLRAIMRRANVRFNYTDYLTLPEDKRCEILDGDFCVVPAPNTKHQRISLNLEVALFLHVKSKNLGKVFHAPCDVILSQEDIVQPDILFIRKERQGIIGEFNIQGAPDLIIEILCQDTREKDIKAKRKIYARFGVQEYWMVDPDAESVEVLVWSELGFISVRSYGRWNRLSSALLPDLRLPLSTLFGK